MNLTRGARLRASLWDDYRDPDITPGQIAIESGHSVEAVARFLDSVSLVAFGLPQYQGVDPEVKADILAALRRLRALRES